MNYLFTESPRMYGDLHLGLAALAVALNIAVYHIVRNKREDRLLDILWALGIFMILAEIFKQWFCYEYLFDRQINLRYFPWQLCSIAMYLSVSARYLKGKAQEAVLVYLSTFSLVGAVMALASPAGMLLDQAVFTLHSFIYHALIISESMIAILILRNREMPLFRSALPLFGVTVLISELINLLARRIINDPLREPNMFYINPYFETTQPVFRNIARSFGTFAEIIVYLLCLILAAYLVFLAEKRLFFKHCGKRASAIQPGKVYIIALNRERSVTALIACIIVSVCCMYAIVIGLGVRPNATQEGYGLKIFRFFTVNSNVFAALGAVLMMPYAVEGIRKKYFTCPEWVRLLQYAGAVSTTITMVFAVCVMFPVGGAYAAFGGIYIWLHVVCPVMALVLLFCVDSNVRLSRKEALIALCPFLVYAVVYYVCVVVLGPEKGGWNDLYKITSYVTPLVAIVVMMLLGLAVTFGIRWLFNRAAEKRHRELQLLWDDSLTAVDIKIEAYGLGRFNGLRGNISDMTIPVDILRDLAEKYRISTGDLMRSYIKGLENGLAEKGGL